MGGHAALRYPAAHHRFRLSGMCVVRSYGRMFCIIGCERGWLRPNFIAVCLDETEDRAQQPRNLGNVG